MPLRSLRSSFNDSFSFWNKRATLRKVLAPFSFSHECDRFLFPCYLFSHVFSFSPNFLTIVVVEFLLKLTILPQKKVFFTRCECTINRSQSFATSIHYASRGMDSHLPRLSTNQRTRNWEDVVKILMLQYYEVGHYFTHQGEIGLSLRLPTPLFPWQIASTVKALFTPWRLI